MVEESYLPITLFVPDITDAQFQEFCDQYPDYFLEYAAEGELIVMPPTSHLRLYKFLFFKYDKE